jgi:hypothetical protein
MTTLKPFIKRVRGYWEIRSHKPTPDRPEGGQLMGMTKQFAKLKRVGPWRPAEIQCEFYGDAKPQ